LLVVPSADRGEEIGAMAAPDFIVNRFAISRSIHRLR